MVMWAPDKNHLFISCAKSSILMVNSFRLSVSLSSLYFSVQNNFYFCFYMKNVFAFDLCNHIWLVSSGTVDFQRQKMARFRHFYSRQRHECVHLLLMIFYARSQYRCIVIILVLFVFSSNQWKKVLIRFRYYRTKYAQHFPDLLIFLDLFGA